jgi:acetyltransferase
MLNEKLINPSSIVVVGGSNDCGKPGGKVLKNLLESNFKGKILVLNPKEDIVQGVKCYRDLELLPEVDTAILSIPSKFTLEIVKKLVEEKETRGFIILSAGYSEVDDAGKALEKQIVEIIDNAGGTLIGPNCIGILTPYFNGTFTEPSPKLDPKGCDFASGSGATAVFIIEAALPKGLSFASIYSVGNSAQIGVEELVKYWDENFDHQKSSRVKLLYLESVNKPQMLLKHAKSLIRKGCRIAAIKAGSSDDGSRAASSHTGAMASSDKAVTALFEKAGIVRCYGREELITTACVMMHKELKGKNIAIITHAGGPGVMLTDILSNRGLKVPRIESKQKKELLGKLYPGSSVENPIDFLATGTAEQLGIIIDYVDKKFDEVGGMVVIFGTPGLFEVYDVYKILDEKMKSSSKPIFPVLPSLKTAREEIEVFLSYGRINFPDEVNLGEAIAGVYFTPEPEEDISIPKINITAVREVIDQCEDGYLSPENVQRLLDAAGICRVVEYLAEDDKDLANILAETGFPVVMKVVGPVHKTDVGGVVLNVSNDQSARETYDKLMNIKGAEKVLIQPMIAGRELFIGAKFEEKFGHMILCGLGGIFIEIFKDVSTAISPISDKVAQRMICSLKSYQLIKGVRGQQGVNQELFKEMIVRLSALVEAAPEIYEMDLNPLLATEKYVKAVDARISLKKK